MVGRRHGVDTDAGGDWRVGQHRRSSLVRRRKCDQDDECGARRLVFFLFFFCCLRLRDESRIFRSSIRRRRARPGVNNIVSLPKRNSIFDYSVIVIADDDFAG